MREVLFVREAGDLALATSHPILLDFAGHRCTSRILHLEPVARATATVGGILAFRDDAFKTHFASVREVGRAVAFDMLGICGECWLRIRLITTSRARTWRWRRMRRYGELSRGAARSSPRQFFPDCTIAMCGYDFREGQPWSAGYITNMFESEFSAHTRSQMTLSADRPFLPAHFDSRTHFTFG